MALYVGQAFFCRGRRQVIRVSIVKRTGIDKPVTFSVAFQIALNLSAFCHNTVMRTQANMRRLNQSSSRLLRNGHAVDK